MPEMPVLEQRQAAPAFRLPPAAQLPVNGIYQSSCRNSQVVGTTQIISSRDVLVVADGFGRMQRSVSFFLSPDCSGSLYAAFYFPSYNGQILGQRATVLPDNGQTVMATLQLVQPAAAQLQVLGAVMQLPTNPAMVGVVVNGVQPVIAPVNQRVEEARVLFYPTQSGLYMTNSRDPGAILDSQGFPSRFIGGIVMTRVQ